MPNADQLPFEFTDDSVAAWLESISSISAVKAGSQLNKVINQIRKVKSDHNLVFPVLIKLTTTTLHLSNTLSSTVHVASQQKNKAISVKIVKLSLQLLRNLSLAFHSLLKTESLEMEQKQQAVYYAFQLIGQYLRISNLFHEMPSETLWDKSGELYLFAINNNCLKQKLTVKIPEFKTQPSIEAALKRNLLFTITAFHKSSYPDNQAIFLFTNQHFDLLKLEATLKHFHYFYWNFDKSIPCQVSRADHPLGHNSIVLDTSALAETVQTGSFSSDLSTPEKTRLFRQLSGYQKLVIENLPSAPIIFNMLSGFTAICDFLDKREKLARIHKLSSEVTEEMPDYTMSLQPLDHQKSFLSQSSTTFQDKKTSPVTVKMGPSVKCLRTSDDNYLIAETQNSDFYCGDLVILVNNTNTVMPGIIRQQKTVGPSKKSRFLIEKFQGLLTAYSINSEQQKSETIIVINEATEHPELLLETQRYHNGSTITFNNKTAKLDSLVEYSPFFVHFQISFN